MNMRINQSGHHNRIVGCIKHGTAVRGFIKGCYGGDDAIAYVYGCGAGFFL